MAGRLPPRNSKGQFVKRGSSAAKKSTRKGRRKKKR
jgi:hypothetical protein